MKLDTKDGEISYKLQVAKKGKIHLPLFQRSNVFYKDKGNKKQEEKMFDDSTQNVCKKG